MVIRILPKLERLTRKYVALGAACVVAYALPTALVAQESALRILRVAPSDSGAPGSIISITFDRPVAGMLDHTVDARRVMSVQPEVDGEYEWRDPATIRFVPRDPFTPGTAVSVSIDTAAIASGGSRTGVRFQFPLHFRGARPLVLVVEGRAPTPDWPIGPMPVFRVLYSTTVNLDSVAQLSRLDFTRECGGSIALKPLRERAVQPGDGPIILNAGGYDRDVIGDRARRVVELQPVDSLWPNCLGVWQVASFDPSKPRDGWRFGVRTAPPFSVTAVNPCLLSKAYNSGSVCEPDGLSVAFSAQVADSEFTRHVHTSPQLTRAAPRSITNTIFSIPATLASQESYTVTIDSTLRDIYGRRVRGTTSFTVTARDRAPGISQQLGLITLANGARAPVNVKVRTVNVDTLAMYLVRVPDSLSAQLMNTDARRQSEMMSALVKNDKKVVRVVVPVHGHFNRETEVLVPIPATVSGSAASSFVGIRFAIAARSYRDGASRAASEHSGGSAKRSAAELAVATRDTALFGLFAQFSSLRVHAKLADAKGAVFVTTSLGQPVSNASIALLDANGTAYSAAKSGTDGLAELSLSAGIANSPTRSRVIRDPTRANLRYIEVRSGAERLVLPVNTTLAPAMPAQLEPAFFNVSVGSASLFHSALTTDREIYRPGEMLYAKAYARYGVAGAMAAGAGDSIRISLLQNGVAPARATTLSVFGTANDSLQIPLNAQLGGAQVSADIFRDGRWQLVAMKYVSVSEFRAPEFLVRTTADTARHTLGDTLKFHVDAKYLFGAPMSGAAVRWSASSVSTIEPARKIRGTEGYSIGQHSWWEPVPQPEYISIEATDSLDRNGQLDVRLRTDLIKVTRPTDVRISLAVTDANSRVVTSSTSAHLDAASFYVAARDRNDNYSWKSGVRQTINAFVVTLNGEHVPNIPIRVTVSHRKQQPDSANGVATAAMRWAVDTLKQFTVTSNATTVPVEVTPEVEGAFDVEMSATDERGRITATNIGHWTSLAHSTAVVVPNAVQLRVSNGRADTATFSVGDTARIQFTSPFAHSNAWITVEREGIIEQRVVRVGKGVTQIPVPVTAAFAPNMFVGVTLITIEDKFANAANTADELLRLGYTQIRVDPKLHQLLVSVESESPKLAPGDSAIVHVRVRAASNDRSAPAVRAEVALWAVDAGLLSLTNYRLPDIFHAIDAAGGVSFNLQTSLRMTPWRTPANGVVPGSNLLQDFLSDFDLGRAGFAGRGGGAGLQLRAGGFDQRMNDYADDAPLALSPLLRSQFRYTGFFVGAAVTDKNGDAVVHAKLPDNITTFHLVATAIGEGNQYGSGEASLLVTRTVVVRPALPRFVRYGDSLAVAAVVNLRDRTSAVFRVTSSVKGATLYGDSVRMVAANDTTSVPASFAVTIPERSVADATRVTFTARETSGSDGDSIESVIPIRDAGSSRAHTVVGAVRDSNRISISLPADIDPARSTVTLSLGSSPVVAMRTNYERLRAYTYYSTDLVLTSARALLALSRTERTLNEQLVTRDSVAVKRDLQSAVDAMAKRWNYSGAFRFWPSGEALVDRVTTADIGMFLMDAQRDGTDVPATLVRGLQSWANAELRRETWMVDTSSGSPAQQKSRLHEFLSERLALTRFLRESGDPNLPSENALMDQPGLFAWEDRVLLAQLMSKREARIPQARSVLEDAWNDVTAVGTRIEIADSLRGYGSFPSHIRPAARLLTATIALMPEYPLIGALIETVLQQGAAEQKWAWNSQDYGSAIEALAEVVSGGNASVGSHITVRGAAGRVLFSRALRTAGASQSASPNTAPNDSVRALDGLLQTLPNGTTKLSLLMHVDADSSNAQTVRSAPVYFSVTVREIPRKRPVTPDINGIVVERWYENYDDGKPIIEAREGQLVRVKLKITVPADRQFVAVEDPLPAGLEAVDLTLHTSNTLGPFAKAGVTQRLALSREQSSGPLWQNLLYGSWESGWWSPWEYKELHDDRVTYFARELWVGSYSASYIARATTSGTFVRPPAHAEEMYNPAVQGRSDGGVFTIRP